MTATQPPHITLTGRRTQIQSNISVNMTCRHGHTRTVYLTDISDIENATRDAGEWAASHVDTCPGPDST